jgi:RecA-family ATPase
MPKYTQNRPRNPSGKGLLPQRTLDYLAHGAGKGNRNPELYHAAQQFRDAGYSQAEAEPRLIARGMADGLSEAECRKTIDSGYDGPVRQPAGNPGGNGNGSHTKVAPGPRPAPSSNPAGSAAGSAAGSNARTLPDPIQGGFGIILGACFLPGEYVSLSGIILDAGGLRRPGGGEVLSVERWQQRTAQKSIDQIYRDPDGLYIRINPMCPGGKTDKDVTAFRHVLVEFDLDSNGKRIPKISQYNALIDSGLPISVILDSGDKSIHGWVRIDAADFDEFKARREIVWDKFAAWDLDVKNKNPSRYSRCPGVPRNLYDEQGNQYGIGRQELLAVSVGPASWAEYERGQASSERDELIKILTPIQVEDLPEHPPAQLIRGVLYQGGRLSFSGGSKMFKSWNLLHCLFCLANGLPYLGFDCLKIPVVNFDFELIRYDLRQRLQLIANVYKLANPFGLMRMVPLRGQFVDFGLELVQEVIYEILYSNTFGAFSIDPIYKALTGYDENSNSDIAKVLRPFDRLTTEAAAAFLYTQHFSKGNQAAKDPLDRMAGGGSFGRDPDTLIMFTAHRESECFTVNIVQRSFAPVEPFVVRRVFPVFVRDDALDPEDLKPIKNAGRPGGSVIDEKIMVAVSAAENTGGIGFTDLLKATQAAKTTFKRRLKYLKDRGEIILIVPTQLYQLSPRNAAKWNQPSPQPSP